MANPVLNLHYQVREILRDQLSLDPRGPARTYKKPYPENYDNVSYHPGFRVSDFVKFTREDSRSTREHIGQFLAQQGEASSNVIFKIRLFPLFV